MTSRLFHPDSALCSAHCGTESPSTISSKLASSETSEARMLLGRTGSASGSTSALFSSVISSLLTESASMSLRGAARLPNIEPARHRMSIAEKAPFQLQRIGSVMEPDPNDPLEAWGVLNPASARSPEGDLFLYPRVVAEGNYSRIGKARVLFDGRGEPRGVERMGYVLEPEERYERSMRTHGGVEDPRVTFVEPLGLWAMVYTAVSSVGPRVAVAVSRDLHTWHRLGLLKYQKTCAVSFNQYGNKDGMFFPDVVLDPKGNPALAILHRPTYQVHRPDGTVLLEVPCDIEESRESIWIAYISLEKAKEDIRKLVYVYGNELLAAPVEQWECLKIGGGTPPVKIPGGWLTYYHGVSGNISLDPAVT
ncbi:MAG TPA: hypothetical protein DEV93_09460, partial [Chloroflexi bacterium]|nr:hypothetical protein [Chloroflexota bacterium]